MSYTIETINPITISGRENGPIQVWEVVAKDQRGNLHKHSISTEEFRYRMRTGNWYTHPSSDIHLMSR